MIGRCIDLGQSKRLIDFLSWPYDAGPQPSLHYQGIGGRKFASSTEICATCTRCRQAQAQEAMVGADVWLVFAVHDGMSSAYPSTPSPNVTSPSIASKCGCESAHHCRAAAGPGHGLLFHGRHARPRHNDGGISDVTGER